MKKHNFSAGPSILSQYALENTAKAVIDLDGTGLSVLEMSHRSNQIVAVADEAVALTKELLDVPDGYSVLFCHGGASMQFCMIPYNLLKTKAAYLDTGSWSAKAIKEAKMFGEVDVVASSKEDTYNYLPKDFKIPSDADYFYFTSNNTIYGTQIKKDFDLDMPVVCDMSSDIFSRKIDVSKYGLIFAGAQKNLGPAGVAVVIIKNDILGKVDRAIPTMLDYQTHIEKESMFNTPPVGAIYTSLMTLRWYKEQGGIGAMYKKNVDKAKVLYSEIDRNKLFQPTIANEDDRSIMNVPFVMNPEHKDLESNFLEFATSKGMTGIKGHRSVGGFRASIYNAMPIESIQALIDCMQEFEKNN
jgi:phosphoserine aminotransferase